MNKPTQQTNKHMPKTSTKDSMEFEDTFGFRNNFWLRPVGNMASTSSFILLNTNISANAFLFQLVSIIGASPRINLLINPYFSLLVWLQRPWPCWNTVWVVSSNNFREYSLQVSVSKALVFTIDVLYVYSGGGTFSYKVTVNNTRQLSNQSRDM